MADVLSSSAQKVQDALAAKGMALYVVELPASTRTAAEAAVAIGCEVSQIAKSLVFRTKRTQRAILVIASGSNRVDEKKMAVLVGEPIERPDAEFVRQATGFVIGGIPPIGHAHPLETYLDEDLLRYERIWAAAGTPNAVFGLTPQELVAIAGGHVVAVK
jgi:prolyl-tRNA editing enzyme YbaK/EbsC (Cys-tRNA(Pro) deacylase)